MSVTSHPFTAAQLEQLPSGSERYELIDGVLRIMTPASSLHGSIVARLTVRVGSFVEQHKQGVVLGAETGFLIERDPDTVLAPDLSFISSARLSSGLGRGYFPGAPDLAVEVVSPNDRWTDVEEKVERWLRSGCRSVWVVSPTSRTIAVHHPGDKPQLFSAAEQLADPTVLSEFTLSVSEVFDLGLSS